MDITNVATQNYNQSQLSFTTSFWGPSSENDSSQPRSPLYEPTSPKYQPEYDDMNFSPNIESSTSYTKESKKRKRIYGEEYKEPTILNVEPQCKILKVAPLDHEEIETDTIKPQMPSTSNEKSSIDRNYPYPTITHRQFNNISINLEDIPKLCDMCYSPHCICYIISKK